MTDIAQVEDTDAAERAVAVLRAGGLVVLPLDGVYALVADAFQTDATQRLLGVKGRGRQVPLSLLIRNPRQVIGLAQDVPESAERLMASYWPGPVTIMLNEQPHMPWDLGYTGGRIGLRMSPDDLLLSVAAEIGPLACSAGNRRGEPWPTTVDDAHGQLGEGVELYLDGGALDGTVSTIVDCSRAEVEVLREGAVPAAEVHSVAAGEVGWGERPGDGS